MIAIGAYLLSAIVVAANPLSTGALGFAGFLSIAGAVMAIIGTWVSFVVLFRLASYADYWFQRVTADDLGTVAATAAPAPLKPSGVPPAFPTATSNPLPQATASTPPIHLTEARMPVPPPAPVHRSDPATWQDHATPPEEPYDFRDLKL